MGPIKTVPNTEGVQNSIKLSRLGASLRGPMHRIRWTIAERTSWHRCARNQRVELMWGMLGQSPTFKGNAVHVYLGEFGNLVHEHRCAGWPQSWMEISENQAFGQKASAELKVTQQMTLKTEHLNNHVRKPDIRKWVNRLCPISTHSISKIKREKS